MAAPALLAVDDPLLTLSHGSAPNVGQVGAGAWLGQSGGADPPATSTPLEQLGTPLRALHWVPMPLPRAMMLATLIQARASSSLIRQYSKTPRPRPPNSFEIVIPK